MERERDRSHVYKVKLQNGQNKWCTILATCRWTGPIGQMSPNRTLATIFLLIKLWSFLCVRWVSFLEERFRSPRRSCSISQWCHAYHIPATTVSNKAGNATICRLMLWCDLTRPKQFFKRLLLAIQDITIMTILNDSECDSSGKVGSHVSWENRFMRSHRLQLVSQVNVR
jgi:hypothetical protein